MMGFNLLPFPCTGAEVNIPRTTYFTRRRRVVTAASVATLPWVTLTLTLLPPDPWPLVTKCLAHSNSILTILGV